MKIYNFLAILFSCFSLSLSESTHAELIGVDLFTSGDSLLTRDTDTNLEWLDLSQTLNLSYDRIEADVEGWKSPGFQHASRDDVCALMNHAGLNLGSDCDVLRMYVSICGFDTDAHQAYTSLLDSYQLGGITSTDYEAYKAVIHTGWSYSRGCYGVWVSPVDPSVSETYLGHYMYRPIPTVLPVLSCIDNRFDPPFDNTITLKKKMVRAIPIRMTLIDSDNNVITESALSAPPVVNVTYTPDSDADFSNNSDLLPAGLADDGNVFRAVDSGWALNLGTKQFSSSGTYNVTAVAGDSSYLIDAASCSGTFIRLP